MESLLERKNRKGMVNQLTVIAFGIIGLTILIGIGLVVVTKLGNSVATCKTGYTYNSANDSCYNSTGLDPTDPYNEDWKAFDYGRTQLGSTGLLSWLPAIIALLIGVFFLSYFAGGKREY